MKSQINGKQKGKVKQIMRKEFKKLTMIMLSLVMMITAMYVPAIPSEAAEAKTAVDYDNSYNIQAYWKDMFSEAGTN